VVSKEKYWWIANTAEGDTAFNNQCVNPKCRFKGNRKHKDEFTGEKWTSGKGTPIYCEKCGELLPRPALAQKDGSLRLLKGFHSAYRRMKWDEPARTLTQNFIYEASDNKIHPEQNRVLSVLEALVVQTIDRYGYIFEIKGTDIGTAKIAEVIGESVPPYLIEKICRMMVMTSSGDPEHGQVHHRLDTRCPV
jgi:DNA (cytosine-5)-methyltransferase 1